MYYSMALLRMNNVCGFLHGKISLFFICLPYLLIFIGKYLLC